MYLFHLVTLGFAGYAAYHFFFPRLPPPGYDINKNLDDMYPELQESETSSEYNDNEECWDAVDEEWNSMTEDERKELLDKELDDYYNTHDAGKGMLLWAYLMGRSQGLKEKSE
jgi:hypothetical protein